MARKIYGQASHKQLHWKITMCEKRRTTELEIVLIKLLIFLCVFISYVSVHLSKGKSLCTFLRNL